MLKKIKIALIEDDPTIQNIYRSYIESSDEMELMTAVYSAESFLKHIHAFSQLDILLLDIELPGMSGLQAIRKIKSKLPDLDIVMLTTFNDDETIFQALRAGAKGYLLKNQTKKEFQKNMLNLDGDGTALSPEIAKKIINYFNPPKSLFSFAKKGEKVTETESRVLHHLVKGLSYQEISTQMDVTINSIRYHVKNIYRKLQVNSRAKLIEKYKDLL